ncbi:hypothetical protein FSC37_09490 [Piscinibacter aquaticus]|uniref:Uncharacterized protein n=1 Tax=Piscinibacter aquaticus TaxID=392597 RepID=A0A5C6U292_9BURK|nr:hypothetical protein FSC37_09490 [Piscinibacter aquaticus]
MTESAAESALPQARDAPNAAVPLSREQLYELVWKEPMLHIAERLGVSSSYMARVCTELRVPRPPRGYWAQLEVGEAQERPSLPPALPGDVESWTVGSTIGTHRPRAVAVPESDKSVPGSRLRRKPVRDTSHELVAGVRPFFLKTRSSHEDGLLRPFKRMLVDIVVSEAALDGALDAANQLFQKLEAKGHRVTFAPPNAYQHMQRAEVDTREPTPKGTYYERPWVPDRLTLVYIGAVPIGLTLFEVTENVEMVYVDRGYLPVRSLSPAQMRRYKEPVHWRTHRYRASGRLCLQAYSPRSRVPWTKQWCERKPGELVGMISQVVRELESAGPELATRNAEADRKAEAERIAREAQWKRQREEAERARRAQARQDARKDLLGAIAAWNEAQGIRSYFDAMEGALAGLDETERPLVADRLEKARALIGEPDPLALLRRWRSPEER